MSEISFLRLRGLNWWNLTFQFRRFLARTFRPVAENSVSRDWTGKKKKKNSLWWLSVSVPLVKGDRVGTGLRGWQGVWYAVQVCFEDCYVCENVGEGSVEPCLVKFLGRVVGGSVSMIDVCWYNVREFYVGWWLCVSTVVRVATRSFAMCLVSGHWSKMCISFPMAWWSQYGHNFWS